MDAESDEPDTVFPFDIADVLKWRIAAELVRRHPKDLWAVRTYPLDGFYDCLTVRKLESPGSWAPSIEMNRLGFGVRIGWFGGRSVLDGDALPQMRWGRFVTGDAHLWLTKIESYAGLPSPTGGLPPSTPSSIAIRWISAFMRAQLLGRGPWQAWTYFGVPGEDRSLLFGAGLQEAYWWASAQSAEGSTALIWPLGRKQPELELAVTADGRLWLVGQAPVNLLDAYRAAGSSVTRLLGDTAGGLLG